MDDRDSKKQHIVDLISGTESRKKKIEAEIESLENSIMHLTYKLNQRKQQLKDVELLIKELKDALDQIK